MKKKIRPCPMLCILFIFIIFVLATATAFGQIQINLGNSPVERWQNDMFYMTDNLTWSHPHRHGSYCWHDGYWGIHQSGRFYLTHDNMGQPLSRTQKTAVGAAIGAGLGGGISGDLRGTAVGASIGALVGYLTGTNDRPQPRVIGQRQVEPALTVAEVYGNQYIPRLTAAALEYEWRQQGITRPEQVLTSTIGVIGQPAQGRPRTYYGSNQEGELRAPPPTDNGMTEEFTLSNGTDSPIFAYNHDQEVCQLRAGETCKIVVPLGKINLRAHAVIRNIENNATGPSLVYRSVPLAMEIKGDLVKFVFP